MISVIELILEIFFAYKVFTEKDRTKMFLWFMTAMILLVPDFRIRPGVPTVNCFFSFVCLARIIKDRTIMEKIREFPLMPILTVILAFHLIQPFFVSWRGLGTTYFYIIQYCMTTYLYIFIGFCISPDYETLISNKKWLYRLLAILTIIALISAVITYNFIAVGVSENSIWTSERASSMRGFRVTSTQSSPNIFGFINVLFAIFVLHFQDKRWKKILIFITVIINLALCGTRAPMVGLIASVCIYMAFLNKRKAVSSILIMATLFFVSANLINDLPYIGKYVDLVSDMFLTGGENTSGSSTDLRERQFIVSNAYAQTHPIWGMGHGYCGALQQEESSISRFFDIDLAGAEGYMFYVLIDYGYIYLALSIIFFLSIIIYFIINRKIYSKAVMLGLPLTIAIIVHLLTSRPSNSWQFFFPIIGACISIIEKRKKRNFM